LSSILQVAIEKCLDDHHQKLQGTANDFTAKKAQEHAANVEITRDELTKQFKQLAKNSSNPESFNGVEKTTTKSFLRLNP
jgi:hypothetical protein